MRALVVIGLGSLVAAAACVPDFAYLDGAGGAGSGDGEAGDRPSRGGGGGDGPGVVAVGVGPTGGPSGPGPGPGPGTSTATSSAEATTGTTGAGGDGDGGATTTSVATTTTGGDATTSTSTGGLVDDGAPCWDGLFGEATSCVGNQVCCYDEDYYAYHTCETAGFCSDYAYELQCNDSGDCDLGDVCCVNLDGLGDLTSITCESSCSDLLACSAAAPCPEGLDCYYVFNPASSHDEYDAYGYCYPPE